MKNREISFPIRGQVLGLFGSGETLTIATAHTEGLATPLYRVDLSKGELASVELGFAIRAVTVDGETLYCAGRDQRIYAVRGGQVQPLCTLPQDLDVISLKTNGQELFALSASSLSLLAAGDGSLLEQIALEKASAFDVAPDGSWLAIGFEDGSIQAYSREDRDHQDGAPAAFSAGERVSVHNAAVAHLLFDRHELQVVSAAADKKLMMTQLRGRPEVSERSAKGHEGAICCMIPAPGDGFFTGGADASVKLWAGGHTNRNASTSKYAKAVISLGCWKMGDSQVLAVADEKSEITLMLLDEKHKPATVSHLIHPIEAWVEREFASADTRLREAALKKLAEFPDRFSVTTISEQALQDSDARLRSLAAGLLVGLEHADTDEQLARLLKSKDKDVYLAAFAQLLQRRRIARLEVARRAIAARHKDLGLEAVAVLAALAGEHRGQGGDQALDALTVLIKVLEEYISELRLAAFAALEKHFDANPVQAVILGLGSTKPDVRVQALRRGYHRQLLQQREFLRLLRRHLNDKDLEVRYTAFVLSLLTRPGLAEPLRNLDEDLQRRLHELDGLAVGKLKPGDARKLAESLTESQRAPLVEAMATPALDICLAGARALAMIGDPRAFGVLLQLSREAAEETRIEVSKAFSALGDSNAIPRLRLLLHDAKINVADAAFTALASLYGQDPLPLVEAGLNAPDAKIRLRAIALIANLLKEPKKDPKKDAKKDPPKTQNIDRNIDQGSAFLEKALNDREAAIRREAFKTLLNAELFAQRSDTLRFALRSAHGDIRREVLLELESQKKQPWALELLGEMLNDADPALRAEAFTLLRQQEKESHKDGRKDGKDGHKDSDAVYALALHSRHEDVRRQALELLLKPKNPELASLDLISGRLGDPVLGIRQQAIQGLIAHQCLDRLEQALTSDFADVRVAAAAAQASYGLAAALPPLLEVIRSEEPKEHKNEWANTVKTAIAGLAALGDAAAYADLHSLIMASTAAGGEKKSRFAREAAAALRFTARPQHREDLAGLFATPDKELKHLIGLAMAAVGDERAVSEVFAVKNAQSLAAAHMLRQLSREHLYNFFDLGDKPLRTQALLLCLLTELGERPATPGACLAGLAAAHLDIRLQAATALEQYADPEAFLAAVSELFNARGPEPWKVPARTVAAIAALLAHAGSPVSLAVAEGLLETLSQPKQEVFDHWWSITSARYVIPDLVPAMAGISREQLLPLVIGTYVGILRLKDDAARPIYRQSALKRLAGLAVAVPEQAEAIATCLKVALYDGSAVVRDEAFERLRGMTAVEELAAEALATEYRDIARKAMELLLAEGQAKATLALLSELQLTATNGIEEEAHEALVRKQGLVTANAAALAARSASLRSLAVRALANLCESDQAARQQLYTALASGFGDVRQSAACFLAGHQDKQALPVLDEMLTSREHKLTRQAIQAFDVLADAAAAGLMLGLLEKEPAHPLADEMFDVIAEIGDEAAAQRALKLIPGHSRLREGIYEAVLQISGYDQDLKFASPKVPEKADGPKKPAKKIQEKAQPKVIVENCFSDKPRALHDGLLEQLLKALSESGESSLLAQLIPKAAFSEPAAVDKHLDALSKFKDAAVREAAVSATALRLREFGTKIDTKADTKAAQADPVSLARRDTLRAALGHPEADTKFLAAEGLALAGHDDGIQVLLTAVDLLQNLSYRQRAVLALGQLAHPRALDLLLRLASHEDHALQESALEAIGHMQASEQAVQIFALLKKFVLGEREGLKMRALKGLRWFDVPEGWRLIRQTAAESGRLQEPAIALLQHDSDSEAAVQCLTRLIRTQNYYGIVCSICRSLQQLCGEVLEAEYLFLLSLNQYAVENVAEGYLEHVCKAGDAMRLLESLEKIDDEEVFDTVKSALLNRETLPAAEALARLPQASREVSDVILQILGRARYKLPAAELAALAAGYWQQWLALRAEDPQQRQAEKTAELRSLLERVAWLSSRLDAKNASVPESFRAMLEDPDPAARSIRLAVLQALLENASVPKELLPVLGQLASQGESELRPVASALLQKAAPAELDAEALLATPQALLQLDFRQQLLARPALLAQAAEIGTGLDQFTPDDIPELARLLSRYVLDRVSPDQVLAPELAPEITPRTIASIIETLGHLQTPAAEAALADFARAAHDANKDDKQIQELGSLAARLQRRSGRQRHKQAPTDWLEVTA